ncbi:MAG: hypothetical protein J6K90_00190 [Tidjanibacter sp.]|nr:hypothetical protein [Tidjanibacter sp.]
MLFGLIHYTEDWRVEGEIELDSTPCVGNIVWYDAAHSEEFEDSMYVIDNIMYGEQSNYLFVKPYLEHGTSTTFPTPAELAAKIDRLTEKVTQLENQIETKQNESYKLLNGLCNDLNELLSSNSYLEEATDRIVEIINRP